jgi:glycosyltransferase involved in cell wall biosynthesis
MTPLVSIIIPTFDRPRYLQEAIESGLAQTYSNIEVLIFDNGTLDETLAVAGDAARRDPRVRFQRNERNLGMSANFNALARAARGEFLVAIGDDDRLLPEFVSRLVGVMRPELGVAFSNHYLINAEGTRLEPESREYTRHYGRDTIPAGVLENANAAAWRQSIPMSASLLRAADLQRLRFREDLNTPDVEFFIRLALQGVRFIFVPEYLMEYRVHLGAVTASGLWTEELVECLTPIEVKPEIEPYKRKLLIPMVVNAVSRCLQQGNMERARAFLRNKYYPRGHGLWWHGSTYRPLSPGLAPEVRDEKGRTLRYALGRLLQGFCANLPASVGSPLYRAVRRVSSGGFSGGTSSIGHGAP